jgi:hypothetical protein
MGICQLTLGYLEETMNDRTFHNLFSEKGSKTENKAGRKRGIPSCGGYSITNNQTGEVDIVPVLAHAVRFLFGKALFFGCYNYIQKSMTLSKKKNETSVVSYRGYTFKRLSPAVGASGLFAVKENNY